MVGFQLRSNVRTYNTNVRTNQSGRKPFIGALLLKKSVKKTYEL